MADRLFFSFADLDWDDDEAVAARVQQVWEVSVKRLQEDATQSQTTKDTVIAEGESDE